MYNTNYKCVKPFDVWLDTIGPDGKKIPYRVKRGTIWRLVWCGGEDPTHFCRCVDEIAQTLDEQGDKESARAIRNTSRDGYVKSYYEASRQTQPLGSPFVSYKTAFVIDNKDIALWHARNDNPPMRVRHILEYIENGEMVGKDMLEYDANTDKWIRVEEECKALMQPRGADM